MAQDKATNLTPEQWMALWQEIERSNRRTVFSDWIEFSETIEQETEMSQRGIDSGREAILGMIRDGLRKVVNQHLDPDIEKAVFSGAFPTTCIESGQEVARVQRLDFFDGATRDAWTVRLEVVVTELSESDWEVQMSWQIESILLEMGLSVPELYQLGRTIAVGWLRQVERGFGDTWKLGASCYWLEAFRHDDAVLGDTVVRQRALVNVAIG